MATYSKRFTFIPLCVACLCLGIFAHAGGYESADQGSLAKSQAIDSAYREGLILYQKGCYDLARGKINYVIAALNADSTTRAWRESRGVKPTRQEAQALLVKINASPSPRPCAESSTVSTSDESSARLAQIQQDAQKAIKERETARVQLARTLEIEREKALAARKKEMDERERSLKLEIEKARQDADKRARETELALKKRQEERRLEVQAIQKRAQEEADRQRAILREQEEERRLELARLKEDAERAARAQADQRAREDRLEEMRRQQLREEELQAREEELLLASREKKSSARQAKALKAKKQQLPRGSEEPDREERVKELLLERDALLADDEFVEQDAAQLQAAMKAQNDAEKLRKADALWRVSKRLYNEGVYEEAIRGFQEIVELEGNPRAKYTTEAKRFIEQSRDKKISADDRKAKDVLTKDILHTEEKMMKEVYETQIPPYIDPPKKVVKQDTTPLVEAPLIRKKLQDKRVTMDFDKVGLKSVIKFLSQESGVNFVASQKVLNLDPTVTARFSDANVIEVIRYLTKSLGLVYRIDKELVWIADPEEVANEAMETRVYYLLRGGGLFTDFTPVSGGSTGLGGSSAQFNKMYTIEDTLKEVVSWPADAKLTYDKRLNALIARNTPQNLQMLEEMLYSLDVEPVQVLIEARFIEIDITDTKDFGIELKLNDDFAFDKEGGNFAQGLASNSGFDFTSFTRASEGLNFTYKGVLTYPQFQAVLHALEETKRIKTLSSPRITTQNSQMASIKVVDEWIYPTRYEFEIVQFDVNGDGDFNDAGETAYQNVPKDFLRRDVGIILKVVPTVGADRKTINLSLIPEVSEATADAFQYSGNVTLPLFTSRNLSTTVVVNSADTVVLGGLVKESRTKTITKVPLLGSIPIIGNLFKKDADIMQRKNLMIFVTAKVLSPSGEEIIASGK